MSEKLQVAVKAYLAVYEGGFYMKIITDLV
jgi:hypothetical protein